jgi:hypothetical protein
MRAFLIAAIAAGLAVPAFAQDQKQLREMQQKRQEMLAKKKKEETERAYQSSVSKMPDKPYDPWRNIRSEPTKDKK